MTGAPVMYFVGVSTTASSINRVFRAWAPVLGIDGARLDGIDVAVGAPARAYRDVLTTIAADPDARGALVTTHKIDVLEAGRDLFAGLDRFAELLGEVSCIARRDGGLFGWAKDPYTSGLALSAFLPASYWRSSGASALLLGAGGASTALLCHLADPAHGDNRPSEIVVTDRSAGRLDGLRAVVDRLGTDVPVRYARVDGAEGNDRELERLAPGGLVVNGTGLGKDGPGSPLSDRAHFPRDGYVWDFNYRGELRFLAQARDRAATLGLHVEDGWTYFVHGWTRAIAEVFELEIPVAGSSFDRLAELARVAR